MGEIKETPKNSPQTGKASEGSEETTPKAEAKTYTEKDIEKAVQVALTKAGRDAKALADKEATLNTEKEAVDTAKAEIAEIQKQIDEAELEAARGDPDKLKELQAKKSYKAKLAELDTKNKELQKREADLNRREAEHEAEIQAAKETQREITIWQIAQEKSVDPVRLKTLAEKFNIEGKENLEELANEIASGKPEGETLKVDSGATSGGKAMPESAKGKIKAGWKEIHK